MVISMEEQIAKCVTDWNMVIAIVGANIGLAAIIVAFILWIFNKLDGDIKSLSNKLDVNTQSLTERSNQLYNEFNISFQAQSQRTDLLYKVLIDLLNKPKTNP